jgi:hypothetical protein
MQQQIITDLPFGGGERLLLCAQHKRKQTSHSPGAAEIIISAVFLLARK